jgi:hypothetical protein
MLLSIANRGASTGAPAATSLLPGPTFEYVGRTALTVVGPISGARYRFERPDARIRIDQRDQPSLAKIPVLRLLR